MPFSSPALMFSCEATFDDRRLRVKMNNYQKNSKTTIDKRYLQMEYYETYYFANMLNSIAKDNSPFISGLHDFLENTANFSNVLYRPFNRFSVLHSFIRNMIEETYYEDVNDVFEDALVHDDKFRLPIENACEAHGLKFTTFRVWSKKHGIVKENISQDSIADYYSFLRDEGTLERLFGSITNEVFFLAFMNRGLLLKFNQLIAFYVSDFDNLKMSYKKYFREKGVLKRNRIPSWARKAVYFRDRGTCSLCRKDLSGLVSINSKLHYDHIVPLSAGGINDVSNIQLLCGKCNLKKSDSNAITSKFYENWFY
jgi:hypothetical protein